jgi:hypothetical protein
VECWLTLNAPCSALDGVRAAMEPLRKQAEALAAPLAATAVTVSESKLFADTRQIVTWVRFQDDLMMNAVVSAVLSYSLVLP